MDPAAEADLVALALFGSTRAQAWALEICIRCKEPAKPKCKTLEDIDEYWKSALCPPCFDSM